MRKWFSNGADWLEELSSQLNEPRALVVMDFILGYEYEIEYESDFSNLVFISHQSRTGNFLFNLLATGSNK